MLVASPDTLRTPQYACENVLGLSPPFPEIVLKPIRSETVSAYPRKAWNGVLSARLHLDPFTMYSVRSEFMAAG